MSPSRFNPLNLAEKIAGRSIGAATRHFLKDSALYSMANFLPRVVGLLIWPLIAMFVPPAGYAIFSNYNSAVTVLVILVSLYAQEGIARYYYEEKKDFPDLLGTRIYIIGITTAIAAAAIYLLRDYLAWMFKVPNMVLWLAALTALAQVYDLIYMQLLLARKQSRAYLRFSWIRQLAYVGLVVAFLMLFYLGRLVPGARYLALVYANMASIVPLGFFFLVLLVREMRSVFRWTHLRYALPLDLTAAGGALALAALNYFDRVFISHKSLDLAGKYAFAYQLGMLISMVSGGVFSAYMPRFYEHLNRGQFAEVQKLFARNLKLLLLAAAGLIAASGPVVYLISFRNPSYRACLPIVPIIVSGYIFMWLGQCQGLYMTYRRQLLRAKMWTQVAAGGLNIALNVWLLPLFDYNTNVAALNTLIPLIAQWLMVYAIARWGLKERTVSLRGAALPLAVYVVFAALWFVFAY